MHKLKPDILKRLPKSYRLPLVEVIWEDIKACADWTEISDVKKMLPPVAYSRGTLLSWTDKCLRLGVGGVETSVGYELIPTGCIIDVCILARTSELPQKK